MASLPPPDPRRWSAWWLARHARRDSVTLTQRNVYILPTRAGWLCGLLLLVLLIGSINYQLNLGYLLTFVLASAAVASMHSAHANLRGLHLSLRAPEPVHAGEIAQLAVTLSDPAPRPRRRHGLGLRLLPARLGAATATSATDTSDWTWFDIADGASSTVTLDLLPLQRGWHNMEALRLETRFPFGLFCAWTLWRPAARLLAWPAPEQPAPPLPAQAGAGGAISRPGPSGMERDGVRAYRRGDAPTQIAWKKSAQALTGGGELVSRDQPGAPLRTLTLRWADTADTPATRAASASIGQQPLPADPQQHRLARLSAWVSAAERSGAAWALDLPGLQLPAGRGEAHRRSALLALATWERADGAAPAGALVPAPTTPTVADSAPLAARALRQAGAPLPREARDTLFLLGVLGWTLLPQFTHVPLWCSGFAVSAIGWRAWLAWRGAALPPRWLLVVALAAAALLTWQQHHSLIGKEAGVSLVVLLAALKTLELRARRDHWVVFGLGFFLVLANFLFSQSLATALAMLVAVLGLLAALTLAHMPAGRPRLWRAARLASWQTLLGAPLVLLLFVFFPRVAPLWSVPSEGLARSGLSDQLRLGDVAELANDDSLAMRVRFDTAPPPPAALYFRGPVLSRHDGQTWRAESAGFSGGALLRRLPAEVEPFGAGLGYELTVEPLRVQTLPLLEMTLDAPQIDAGTPPPLRRLPDLQWVSARPLAERLRVRAVAHLGVRWRADAGLDLGAAPQRLPLLELQLPAGAHPRSVAWAQALQARPALAGAGPEQLAQALLDHIRQGAYSYTLSPGLSDPGDPIDAFWLDRKTGFCEHYASTFVVLMRAMGVPARIVTGYQGGQLNALDGVLEVRQSDAHAWAEYWQAGRGWVRADPTAAVAPERVQRGQRLRPRPGLVGGTLVELSPALAERLREVWSALDHRWNQWVLGHDQTRQLELLRQLGWPDIDLLGLGRVLLLGLAALGLLGAGWAAWDSRRQQPRRDPWLHAWLQLQAQLRRRGLVIEPHQTPAWAATAAAQRWGATAEPLAQALQAFELSRYGRPADQPDATLKAQLRRLDSALRQLPRR
jgi:transglutaminase-like putative cysteine protease/uncharacterized protein (DUF58 family)